MPFSYSVIEGCEELKVIQSLNQNALLVIDQNGKEIVALGKGIGFSKKKGDEIDSTNISRIFVVKSDKQEEQIKENVKSVDNQLYSIAEDIVKFAELELKHKMNEYFIFTIAKHIEFAIERNSIENIEYDPFQFQLNYLYPDEYEVALKIIEFLNEKYELNLKRQEVSFFTLHFVNSMIDSENFNEVVKLSELMSRILEIIDDYANFKLQKSSVDYSRFVVHLRYFLVRTLSGKKDSQNKIDDRIGELLKLTKEMYREESRILDSLKLFLSQEYNLYFGIDEDLYLLLHLVRILRKGE